MASKLTDYEEDILQLVLAGRSYASIGKFLSEERGCRTDGPAVYRWLKSRQRKLLARQALVHPSAFKVVLPEEVAQAPLVSIPVVRALKASSCLPEGEATAASEFDKLMLETTEKKSIFTKKR